MKTTFRRLGYEVVRCRSRSFTVVIRWILDLQLLDAIQPALKHIQPTVNKWWLEGKKYSIVAKEHVLHAYGISKTRSQKAWKDAKPRLEKTWKDVKASFSRLSACESLPMLSAQLRSHSKAQQILNLVKLMLV